LSIGILSNRIARARPLNFDAENTGELYNTLTISPNEGTVFFPLFPDFPLFKNFWWSLMTKAMHVRTSRKEARATPSQKKLVLYQSN